MAQQLIEAARLLGRPSQERAHLERRAKALAWGSNAWHLVEFGIASGAGIAASSIALIGFGADSLIEAASGLVIVWLFSGARGSSERAERLAQRLVAAMYFVPAAYIAEFQSASSTSGKPRSS